MLELRNFRREDRPEGLVDPSITDEAATAICPILQSPRIIPEQRAASAASPTTDSGSQVSETSFKAGTLVPALSTLHR